MGIFKKKPKNVYDSQPRIDFNDAQSEPIVQSEQPLDNTKSQEQVQVPLNQPFQKVTFEEFQKTMVVDVKAAELAAGDNYQISTGFVADSYNDAPKMANLLLTKGQLIVHLDNVSKEERIRILDFISGVMYAFDGKVVKKEHKTYEFMLGTNDQ